jgi:LuxR family maltose regulon positive regulatory protein
MEMALSELKAYQAQYDAALGKQSEAVGWAETLDARTALPPGYTREIELFCLSRVWIRLGAYKNAWNLLTQLEQFAKEGQNHRQQAEAQLLLALCAFQQNRRDESFALIETSILFGMRNGYVRLYLDEGEPLRALLLEFLRCGRHEQRTAGWLQNLLAGFPRNPEGEAGKTLEPQSPNRKLVEPLSERELEVLALMAQGMTNPQIADHLILSLSTVKTHLNNIFGKLNVRNRAEAVLRAKEYNLL